MNYRLEDYILQHIDAEGDLLAQINRKANVQLVNGRMVAGHLQGRMLKMFCRMIKPKRILELGTMVGYSALCMAEALSDDAEIHTIEHNDELEQMIRDNLSASPYGNRIRLYIGDALQLIPCIDEIFDLVLIDADKREYLEYYEAVLPKLRHGGFILADNTLWGGKVTEPLQHGDRQTKAIIDFNNFVAVDERIEKVILPLRDGLTVIMKK